MNNTVVIQSETERHEYPLDALKIDSLKVQRAFKKNMEGLDTDLLTIISCAACADRAFRRPGNDLWARKLALTVPVFEYGVWEEPAIHKALIDCLTFATGDSWQVCFKKLKGSPFPPSTLIPNLPSGTEFAGIILYSGGVDSGATLYRWKCEHPDRTPLPIGIDSSSKVGEQIKTALGLHRPFGISFSVHFPQTGKKEPTYRTRSLVFMAAGAVAARLGNLSQVVVAENGQGAVGPSLVPFGDEHPYVNNSPLLGHQFSALLARLWPTAGIRFTYPNVWKTKARLIRECHSLGHASDWTCHPSCSRTIRGEKQPCGICGNCILRRVAVLACSDLPLAKDLEYKRDLCDSFKDFTRAEKSVAMHAVMGMSALAKLSHEDQTQILARTALQLSHALPCKHDEALTNLRAMVDEHAREWRNFTSSLRADSWVLKLDEVAQ